MLIKLNVAKGFMLFYSLLLYGCLVPFIRLLIRGSPVQVGKGEQIKSIYKVKLVDAFFLKYNWALAFTTLFFLLTRRNRDIYKYLVLRSFIHPAIK